MEEANYRTSVLTRNFPSLPFFSSESFKKNLGHQRPFLVFPCWIQKNALVRKSIFDDSWSLFLFARHSVWPWLQPQNKLLEGSNQRMPHLGFHSCQRLSLPLNAGSVSLQSIYNDINYLKFPQISVQLNTCSATSSQTYTSRNYCSHSSLISYFTQRNLSISSISNKFIVLLLCASWCFVPSETPTIVLEAQKC